MHLPKTNVVRGNLILRHLHLGGIVHAKTNKVKAWLRRRDLVIRDFRILRTGREEAVLGPVEQFVTANFYVLTTYDEDVQARESVDSEPRDGNAFDRCLDSIDAFVLADEIG